MRCFYLAIFLASVFTNGFAQSSNREENCLIKKYERCAVFDTIANQIKVKILNFKRYQQQKQQVKLGFEGHKKYYTMNAKGECISWVKSNLVYIYLNDQLMCTLPLQKLLGVKGGSSWCVELWL
ncbi:hypothetical protein BKI52_03890 [marine bacterium AO1-C]|nr:hypothetical protein BKI52_03890 [marine bacterium AO1-C]